MGEARNRKTASKILRDHEKAIADLRANQNNKKTPPTISIPSRGTSAPGNTIVDVLRKQGDAMLGPIAFNPHSTIIDNGHIDISPNTTSGVRTDTSYCYVLGQGTPDDLNWIDGAQFNGQFLIIQGTNQQVINLKSALNPGVDGNILTPDGADVVLDGTVTLLNVPAVILTFDITAPGGAWRVISGAGGGGGGSGLTDPIILNENDLGTIGAVNQLIDWSTHNFYRMTLNDDISITMQNLPASGKWEQVIVEFTQDVVGNHGVTFLDTFANGLTPTINPGANSKSVATFYAYNDGSNVIMAFDVNSNFTEFPEYDLGTLGPATFDVDWSNGSFQRVVLSGDVTITHTNLPPPGKFNQLILEVTQDLTGNHNITWVQAFNNGVEPIPNAAPTSKTTMVFYSYNTGVITLLLAFETLSANTSNRIHATMVANQFAVAVGGRIAFDSVLNNDGITIGIPGIFGGFKEGRVYELECAFAILNAVGPAEISAQWYDINGATLIGTRGEARSLAAGGNDSAQCIVKAIFIPATNLESVEVQIVSNSDIPNNLIWGAGIAGTPASYAMIKDIT